MSIALTQDCGDYVSLGALCIEKGIQYDVKVSLNLRVSECRHLCRAIFSLYSLCRSS